MSNSVKSAVRQPAGYLRPLGLALLACGLITPATAANLVPDPGFTLGSSYWRMQPATVIKSFAATPTSQYNAACISLTSVLKVGASKPENLIYLPGIQSLGTDQRYRLSFEAFRDTASSTARSGKLLASVTATEITTSAGYFPLVYGEQQLDIGSSASGAERRTYSFDFTTPVDTTKFPISSRPTEIMFQALSDNDSKPSANICVTNVQLTPLGSNFQTMLPTTPVIRYNQVVVTEEEGSESFFTILNPPIPSTLELVNDTGTYVEAYITSSEKEVHSDIPYFKYAYVNDPRNTPSFRLRLKNAQGTVVAETPVITPKVANPYTQAAPNLKRDALHFFYAQRAGQAITDNRYPAYRNWFNREAGHLKKTPEGVLIPETATCFSGKDNFGNDFAGACKVVATGDTNPSFDVSGGWYDAGDHGKYVVNAAAALWQMQNIIETKQANGTLNQDFPPNMLGNGSTGRSDLLEEAKYEMEWLLKMQIKTPLTVRVPTMNYDTDEAPAGYGPQPNTPALTNWSRGGRTYQLARAKMVLKLDEVQAQGMVFSAVRDNDWTSIPTAPAKDTKPRVLDYPTTTATMNFAAVAAQCYRIWKNDSIEGTSQPNGLANRCKNAAEVAWKAVVAEDVGQADRYSKKIYRYGEYSDFADNATGGKGEVLPSINLGGGAYADASEDIDKDALYWAGVELYLANLDPATGTATPKALNYLKGALAPAGANAAYGNFRTVTYAYAESIDWKHNHNMAILSLLAAKRNDQVLVDAKAANPDWPKSTTTPLSGLASAAAGLLTKVSASPFGVPHVATAEPFNWASNADIANAGVLLAAHGVYSGSSQYTKAARRVMSYLFGNNPMGKSYVTGYGTNPVQNPHHRFWAKHADIRMPPAPPGMLVGGPNGKWSGTLVGNYSETSTGSGVWNITEPGSLYYMTKIVPKCNPFDTAPAGGIYKAAPKQGGIACYQDDYRLFMTNEVAINWNAPLLWLAAFLK